MFSHYCVVIFQNKMFLKIIPPLFFFHKSHPGYICHYMHAAHAQFPRLLPLHALRRPVWTRKLLLEDHWFADFKTHRAAFQIFADPFFFDVQEAPLCFKWSSLTCSVTLNSEPSSGRWVEKQTSSGNFWEKCLPASLSFPECSSGPCVFLGAHICAKSSGPDLLTSIFKPYWGSQL